MGYLITCHHNQLDEKIFDFKWTTSGDDPSGNTWEFSLNFTDGFKEWASSSLIDTCKIQKIEIMHCIVEFENEADLATFKLRWL